MVLGCTSDAGKSLLVTALCAWFRRQGVHVAPFKAQNMSNNARVVSTEHGAGEIGVAQWLQARAAGLEPDVRMNPVLLKPEADTQSQVIVRGIVDRELTRTPWRDRHEALWGPMGSSFDELRDEFDLVIIEGAGSPAEINLVDQVNNRMIDHADAAALLVSDIDRGGSFAHLYGTWALVPDVTRDRLAGFVLNKFRGDASLLSPGPERLTEMTGMANAGVIPMLQHRLPREEGAVELSSAPPGAPTVLIPRLPFGSNLDEFHLLSHAVNVRWVSDAAAFDHLDPARDMVILPGSKHVMADMAWMRSRGLDRVAAAAAATGVRVVGICGGAMMLGRTLHDPDGVEGQGPGGDDMLGLLDITTTMLSNKLTVGTDVGLDGLDGPFGVLNGLNVSGYEIRYGEVESGVDDIDRGRSVWQHRNVMASTVHGLFESPELIQRLFTVAVEPVLDDTFELLADAVEAHLDTALLRRLVDS